MTGDEHPDLRGHLPDLPSLTDLPIDPGSRAEVAAHLRRLLALGRLLEEFPLPEEIEPAPVFRP